MKKAKKGLLLVLCAVLLVGATIAGTVAYLTSTTEVVNNTFTAGNVKITLDEAPVDLYGEVVTGDRRTANEYKLIPGHSYTKDPTVHVAADSEDCWLFVKITDEIADIQDGKTIAEQLTEKGWSPVTGTTNVYAYKDIVAAGADVVVFESFKIKEDAAVSSYVGKTITVQAYAVQSDGFASAQAAWTAAPATWTTN